MTPASTSGSTISCETVMSEVFEHSFKALKTVTVYVPGSSITGLIIFEGPTIEPFVVLQVYS